MNPYPQLSCDVQNTPGFPITVNCITSNTAQQKLNDLFRLEVWGNL